MKDRYYNGPNPKDLEDPIYIEGEPLSEGVYISVELPDGVEIVEYPYPIEAVEVRKWSDYAPKEESDERE